MNRMLGYLIIVCASIYASNVLAQSDLWQTSNTASRASSTGTAIQYFDSDDQALRRKLNVVPNELRGQTETIFLPMPDGTLSKYSIVESSIMEDGLSEEFPQIKSYKVYGIDDPVATGRVDISPKGFRGMLMTSQGRVFIDPVNNTASANRYSSSLRAGGNDQTGQTFQCDVHALPENDNTLETNFSRNDTVNRISGSLIIYRMAVSATSEYVTAVGGTLTTAMAEINTTINRVNQIYERDLGIRFSLVSNNSSLIEVAPANFGFTNSSPIGLLSENQVRIDTVIGNANYDIGHVFGTSGGGIARLGAVCGIGIKAQGATGLPNPTGDRFYVDYVAHEIGHQFGGNHTFNGSTDGCGGSNRNASTAFEPGSGSSILGYSGICGAENIASNSDATFHAGTIAEINSFVSTGGGASCAAAFVITPANSNPTSVSAGVDHIIPSSTAFRLTGSAIDAGDTLTYQWDQMNAGTVATTSTTLGTDQGNNPLFRSYIPQPNGIRDFPALNTQVNGTTPMLTLGETLPTTARTLNFRLTVRDGKSGQGTDDVAISVDASGPFEITAPSATGNIAAGINLLVNWNLAGTDGAPVNCANVDIELLTFSADGSTYAVTDLSSPTPNDGDELVFIPNMNSSKARFSVSCSDNVFYDISNSDENITGGASDFPNTGNSTNISTAANFTNITTVSRLGDGGGGVFANSLLLTFLLGLSLSGYWLRGRMLEEIYR